MTNQNHGVFVTDAFQEGATMQATEMNATSKDAVSKLVKLWENKNAQRAVKGAGLSMMALSLAACGGSSSTDSTTTTPVETPVTPTNLSFDLTKGINEFTGGDGNDTFDATEDDAGTATLSNMDTLVGGAGTDTLKVVDATAIDTTALTGLSISGIETINLTSGAGVVVNTTTWTGATTLTIKAGDDVTATASATTDITVNATALTGGAGNELVVDGGKTVTITSADTQALGTANTTGIAVGGTTAAAGAVSVTHTDTVTVADDAGATVSSGSTVTVTGGTTITVNSNVASIGVGDNAGDIFTIGAVTVNGDASTTAVTVNQTAATAAYAATGDKAKITSGAVTIEDKNAATASDTIKTVTLENFGATEIKSTVLDTLNITETGSGAAGAITLTQTASDTSTAATTLTVNAAGSFGKITGTQADVYTTLNVASTSAVTIADIEMDKITTLNVSGAGVTTFTALTDAQNAALTSIVSTGGGVSIATQLATDVKVTGGSGAETISVAATTKAIDLGAGDDVVTISTTTLGTGGSIAGGLGVDTIVANTNGSAISGLATFSGFETLRVAGAAAQGSHNANTFTAIEVGALGGGSAEFTNVAAGVGLTQLASLSGGNDLEVKLADTSGTADSFTVTLKSAGAIGAAGEIIKVAGVETINIVSDDTDTTAHQNTIELVATSAKTVTVTGDAGLKVVNADASITSFDASGVTLGKVTDTGITFDSTNTTVGEAVTIKGSNGVDLLTGSATAADTIYGNDGADTLVYDGGADVFYGGTGKDKFDITADGTKAAHVTIADLAVGDTIDLDAITDGNAGISDGALGAKITLGASATLAQYLDEAAKDTTDAGPDGVIDVSLAKWFQFDGNTYLVVDNSKNATFTDGTDSLVQITGLVDLSTSTFATEILTVVAPV